MTTAEQIAKRFGDNGLSFTDSSGVTLDDACHEIACRVRHPVDHGTRRYLFSDGSAITIAHDAAWDLGYTDCWCWQGQGHDEDCTAES